MSSKKSGSMQNIASSSHDKVSFKFDPLSNKDAVTCIDISNCEQNIIKTLKTPKNINNIGMTLTLIAKIVYLIY